MIGGAVMMSLMLPLSDGLFDPPAEAIVDNLLICAAVHGSGSGPLEPKGDLLTQRRVLGRFGQFPNGLHSFPPLASDPFRTFRSIRRNRLHEPVDVYR